jgi:RHS repeat-associated protein
VVVGLYTDTPGNDPGTLLAQGTISSPTAGAWNSMTIPAVSVTAGATYWIAVLAPSSSTGTLEFRDVPNGSGSKSETSLETTLTSLPTSWTPSGGTWLNGPLSAYAVQVGGDPPASYGYDPLGNRLSWNSTSYAYDRADRILTAGATSYTVNFDGNLTARGSDSFVYDQANRLTSATVGGTTSTYVYDGDGKRTSMTVGATTTSYVYDVSGGQPVLLTDTNRKYVWGASGLAYETDLAGNVQGISHIDGLGSVRSLTDGIGTLFQTYRTDAFGVPTATQGSSSQPFQFTGEQVDPTGFEYLRARIYDPQTGRLLQRDPLATLRAPNSCDLNRFTYVKDNPTSYIDPMGLSPNDLCQGARYQSTANLFFARSGIGALEWDFYLSDQAKEDLGPVVTVSLVMALVNGRPINPPYAPHTRENSYDFHSSFYTYDYLGGGGGGTLNTGDNITFLWWVQGENGFAVRYVNCDVPEPGSPGRVFFGPNQSTVTASSGQGSQIKRQH